MRHLSRCVVAAAVVAALGSTAALAGSVVVENIGGGISLHSRDLSATVFGAGAPTWSAASLASVHQSLALDGVVTNGKVTVLLADTDHGLALLTLIDQEAGAINPEAPAQLHMTSFANGNDLAYIHDVQGTVQGVTGSFSNFATGDFGWNSNGAGDGFGWANLASGNTMTFHFDKVGGGSLGLDEPGTFQFVSWTGTHWSVINIPMADASFTEAG